MAEANWREFAAREKLADTLAQRVSAQLAAGIELRGTALLAVSGGSTPPLFLRALSRRQIDWEKVVVTLVDERFVPAGSERSNARMVTLNLLQHAAAKARFVELHREAETVEQAADLVRQDILALKLPFDAVVLGMGTDGHTASFFPDADRLAEALDPEDRSYVLPIHAASAAEPRLSLSLAALATARFVAVHIEGLAKKEVLMEALAAQQPMKAVPPIATMIEHAAHPVEIYWAPDED